MFKSIPPFCRSLIVVFIASAILEAFLQTTWVKWLALYAPAVFDGFQVWRLVTYPFVASFWSAIMASLIVWFFGSELEQIIHMPKLATMLAISIVVGGVLFIFLDPNAALFGPVSISIFILTGFAYMWPQREISIIGLFWVRAWVIALVYFIIALIPSSGTRLDLTVSGLFAPFFAALSAIALFHFSYKQHSIAPSFVTKVMPQKKQNADDSTDPKAVEKRIDQILDKIASKGMNSLSQEEKDFLLKHSR